MIRDRSRFRQRGMVLVTVMMVMMASMLLGSALINHFAVQEAQAIEQNLAHVRATWAMMGHVNYALSRAWNMHDTLCSTGNLCDGPGDPPDDDDAPRLSAIAALFLELQTQAGGTRRWTYSEYLGNTYFFEVGAVVTDRNPAVVDGRFLVQMKVAKVGEFGVTQVGAFEALTGLNVPDLWVEVCLYNAPAVCPAVLNNDEAYGKSMVLNVLRCTAPAGSPVPSLFCVGP